MHLALISLGFAAVCNAAPVLPDDKPRRISSMPSLPSLPSFTHLIPSIPSFGDLSHYLNSPGPNTELDAVHAAPMPQQTETKVEKIESGSEQRQTEPNDKSRVDQLHAPESIDVHSL